MFSQNVLSPKQLTKENARRHYAGWRPSVIARYDTEKAQRPQPVAPLATPIAGDQANNAMDIPSAAIADSSNTALPQAIAMMAESMARMQGAISTILQN